MKFDKYPIHPGIKKAISKLEWKKPTDIQFKTIGPVLRGDDLLAIAQTGTGKTAAFAIPVLHLLAERTRNAHTTGVRCIVMAPTHELAAQIEEVFHQLGKHLPLETVGIYGGVDQEPQIKALKRGVDIVVATPGRMFDLVSQGHLDLKLIQILVLDEADHMLEAGFYNDIKHLLKFLPKRRQTLFFSATIDEKIKRLSYSLVTNPIRIQISPRDPVSKNVEHSVAFVDMDDKRFFLERCIRDTPEGKILVFVRTKVRAERVLKAMERVGLVTETIHGDKTQEERTGALNRFKKGEIRVLITTDLSARGIDIPGVDFVINYDLPEEKPESYVHRIGRTGRGNAKGGALSFCSPEERPMLELIEAYITKPISRMEVTQGDLNETRVAHGHRENDWKSLIADGEAMEAKYKNLKRKKKNRK